MYRMTAHSGCSGGPCPLIAEDTARGKVAIQTYDLAPDADRSALGATPNGEHLGEMDVATFEYMLAQHLSDAALKRIMSLREEPR